VAHVKAFVLALALFNTDALAQAATEVFIPIGRSPGVSGKTSIVGVIESREPGDGLVVAGRQFFVDFDTQIYLDRNKLRETNTIGTTRDLQIGVTVEVKPQRENERVADWIKVEVTQ